jgi:hypothetical protein
MTRLAAVGLGFALAGSLLAQRRVVGAGRPQYGYGTILNPGGAISGPQYGRGNILFPGGVTSFPSTAPIPLPDPRLGSIIPNYPPRQPDGGFRGGRGRTIAIPYAVPVYVGGGYGYDNAPQQPAANVTVVIPQQPTPQVVINHNYTPETANPVMRDYSGSNLPEAAPRSPEVQIYTAPTPGRGEEPRPRAQSRPSAGPSDDKPNIYLIALKDGTVRSAIGYWSEEGVLHYVTPQGSINRFTLDFLDTATTEQLNRERGLEWELKTR